MIGSDLYFEQFDPKNPYPDWLDATWIASDRDGNIGAFFTASIGPIPNHSLKAVDIPIEKMEKELRKLPVISSAVLLVSNGSPDSYVDLAERGFYVYDYLDIHRSGRSGDWLRHAYEIITTPTNPITIDMIPGNIRDHIKELDIPSIAFAEEEQVNIRDHFECCKHD